MQEQFTKHIFLQNLLTVSDDRIIYSSGRKVVENFHHIKRYEGIHQAISTHKDFERCIKNRVLGIPDEISQERWKKTTISGLPRKVITDHSFTILMGSPGGKQGLLTIFAYYRLFRLPVEENFSSVTDPGTSENCNRICDAIVDNFNLDKRFEVDPMEHQSYIFPTSKAGASGPKAMGDTAYSDLAALLDSGVIQAVKKLAQFTYSPMMYEQFIGTIAESISKIGPSGIPTRLHLLAEGGGKTRIICIPDIWSQMALKPLHEFFMDCLRSIPGDGTFSHDSVAIKLRDITKERGMICYDLKTVTDRLPILLQRKLVAKLTNEEVSHSWARLITERDFHYKDRVMRYAVGQPMGLLSSWPVMALTHHAIIQYALRGVKDKTYFVIGDDMAMSSQKGALEYRRIIESLGVEINLSKSILSKETMSGEIAKRVFSHGLEISPIPPRILVEATGSDLHFLELLRVIQSRANLSSASPRFITEESLTRLFKKSQSWKSPAMHIFLTYPLELQSSNIFTPISGIIDMWDGIYGINYRFERFINKAATKKIANLSRQVEEASRGKYSCDSVLVQLYRVEVIRQLQFIVELCNMPDDLDDIGPPTPSEMLFEFMSRPDPWDMKVFLHKSQVRKQKTLAMIEEFWQSLTGQDPHHALSDRMKAISSNHSGETEIPKGPLEVGFSNLRKRDTETL